MGTYTHVEVSLGTCIHAKASLDVLGQSFSMLGCTLGMSV